MKSPFVLLGVLGLAAGVATCSQGAEPSTTPPELLARLHFAGFEQLKTGTNALTLKEVWDLPASADLRDQVSGKIARAIARLFSPRPGATNEDCARLVRPLVEDFWRAESHAELRVTTNGAPDWAWALRLDEPRTRIWHTNFSQLLDGWDARKDWQLSFAVTNSWFVLSAKSRLQGAAADASASILRQAGATGRPVLTARDYWLKAEADLPRLFGWLGRSEFADFPKMELSLTPRGNVLRTQAKLVFSKPRRWRPEPWQIPVHTIRDPQNTLISFTAIQGFAPWLNDRSLWRELGLTPPPNQFFTWGQGNVPFQIQAAFPVGSATNWLKRLSDFWVPRLNTNLAEFAVGEVRSLTDRAELLWRGLPMIIPYLRPAPEPEREFLWGGIFPMDLATNPPPAALLAQLTTRTNLLFYDWEITQGRLGQLRPLAQLLSVVVTLPVLPADSAGTKWLDAVQPRLGNTITELAGTSDRELTLVRNSHIGLSALELLALAYWIESTNFPAVNFQMALQPVNKPLRQMKRP